MKRSIKSFFSRKEAASALSDSDQSSCLTASGDSDSSNPVPPQEKLKRRSGALTKWDNKYGTLYAPHIRPSSKGSEYFFCALCKKDAKFSKMGHGAIKHHLKTEKHKKELEDYNTIPPMTHFVNTTNVSASDKTHAAELALAYHTAFHNHAQRTASCTSDLIPEVFSDSEVGKRYASAHTKSTKLVKKVLHPYFKTTFLDEITASGGYFSVGMDASNHKETKLYAITMRYFNARGVVNIVLDVAEMPSEKATDMAQLLRKTLRENGLSIKKMLAFTADNTNANFGGERRGGQNNVYYILKLVKPNLVGIGCSSHICHNAADYGANQMDIDFEAFALKVLAHFSNNARRMHRFKEVAAETGVAVTEFTEHSDTRWLTLGQLAKKLLSMWDALSAYFQSCSSDELSKKLRDVFRNEGELAKHKALTSFFSFALGHFNTINLATQANGLTVTELIETVGHFRLILSGLARDRFFGNATEEALEQLAELTSAAARRRIEDDFCTFYVESLDYFERWFSYLDDYKDMQWLELKEESFNFQALRKSYRKYISTDSDRLDKLYVEFQMAKGTLTQMQDTSFATMSIPNKCLVVLKNANLVELRLLVSALLSIFPSNAYCETVFSHINNIWTDNKSQLHVDTLNALVSVVCNTPYKGCVHAFHCFLKCPQLIKDARSNAKYE